MIGTVGRRQSWGKVMEYNRTFVRIARIPVSDMTAYFRENAMKDVIDYSVWGLGVLYIVAVAISMAKV